MEYFESLLRNKSNWIPPKTRDPQLEEYIDIIRKVQDNSEENKTN